MVVANKIVYGYTIRQIEDCLHGQRTWENWEDYIRRRYNNPTERFLNELFNNWE